MNSKHIKRITILFTIIIAVLLLTITLDSFFNVKAKDVDDCLACHEDQELTMDKNGKKISLYVNPNAYKKSVHGNSDCIDCHSNYNPDNIPHTSGSTTVNCSNCHDANKSLQNNVHKNVKCYDCHSKHYTKPAKDYAKDQTKNCIKCHSNSNIRAFENSIHGKRNVKCESCHKGGHASKNISKNEIENSCGSCHQSHKIAFDNSIHRTVLKEGSKSAPTCVDCHGAHKIISSKMSVESQSCLKCHLDEKLFPGDKEGSAKFVTEYKTSIHSSIQKDGKTAAGCSDCHGNHMIEKAADPRSSLNREKMFETCSKCHSEVVEMFTKSDHGIAYKNNSKDAPSCTDCHGEHGIKSALTSDEFSKLNQTELCLDCHSKGKITYTIAAENNDKDLHIDEYKGSFHYIALKKGNTKAATCSDCHGAHEMKDIKNPDSRITHKNISRTCGSSGCHVKQFSEFTGSIHQQSIMENEESDAPNCVDCHGNHQVMDKDDENNPLSNSAGIVKLCSDCHADYEMIENYELPEGMIEAYGESFHGLAVRGGSTVTANCGSCHGNHDIRTSTDPLSSIHKDNLANTCGECHPGATEVLLNSPIHVTEASTQFPLLFWITNIYILIIVLTISFMVIHNILDYKKKLKLKKT